MLKRLFDLALSLLLIVLFLPTMLPVIGIIMSFQKTPPFFIQERLGLRGRKFNILKFQTMTRECDSNGDLLPDEVRITSLGRWLRATSFDEIPTLLNVFRGEMSFVGPRPLLIEYLPLYSPEQARRHEVRPGITGWAQVNGRNALSWEEKFKLDVWYVDNQSFWLDIKILFLTAYVVVTRKGISAQGEATMPKFQGTVKR